MNQDEILKNKKFLKFALNHNGKDFNEVVKLWERELLDYYELIIILQLAMERLDTHSLSVYNVGDIKPVTRRLIQLLTKPIEKNYNSIFKVAEKDTLKAVSGLEQMVKMISTYSFPDKMVLTEIVEAYNKDAKSLIGIIKKINKKNGETTTI